MSERGQFKQTHQFETPVRTNRLKEFVNFVRVSPVQQLVTAALLASAAAPIESNYNAAIGLVASILIDAAIIGLNETIAINNYREYRKIKNMLTKHGWDRRIIKPTSDSWCERTAARAAAIDTGFRQEVDQYYLDEGYRWYHIFPYTKSRKP